MATKHDTAGWTYYTWDVDESLKTIQTPTVTLESKYNSRMQRVWRSENGIAEKLIYDSQKLIAEATSTGTALNRYYLSEGGSVYSPLLAQLGSEHWFLFDALGTTLGLTSETSTLTDTFKYEAFGTSLGRTGTTATPYQYVGGYGYFNEASISNAGYRWYTPTTGKWLSRDPLRIGNPYTYVENMPTVFVDPMGLQGIEAPEDQAALNGCIAEINNATFGGPDQNTVSGYNYGNSAPVSFSDNPYDRHSGRPPNLTDDVAAPNWPDIRRSWRDGWRKSWNDWWEPWQDFEFTMEKGLTDFIMAPYQR